MSVDSWQLGGVALGITLALLGIAAWLKARDMWRESGLPAGKVLRSDMGEWFPQDEPLFAPDLQLLGKPDYLVREPNGAIIPVEVKSTRAPDEPYQSHILQLAAYCLLVEQNYGKRPFYGILQYRDRAFAIDYTTELEGDLLDVLANMRADLFEENVDRDHEFELRCARCGVREFCQQRLA